MSNCQLIKNDTAQHSYIQNNKNTFYHCANSFTNVLGLVYYIYLHNISFKVIALGGHSLLWTFKKLSQALLETIFLIFISVLSMLANQCTFKTLFCHRNNVYMFSKIQHVDHSQWIGLQQESILFLCVQESALLESSVSKGIYVQISVKDAANTSTDISWILIQQSLHTTLCTCYTFLSSVKAGLQHRSSLTLVQSTQKNSLCHL